MRNTSIIAVALLVLSQHLMTQEASVGIKSLPLTIGKEIQTDVPLGSLMGTNRCDSDGRVYVHVAPFSDTNPTAAPVFRINTDGTSKSIDPKTMSGTENKQVTAFAYAVDRSGGVHFIVRLFDLTTGEEHSYIASFSSDGTYRSRFEVKKDYRPNQLVALSNGSYLVSGLMAKQQPDKPQTSFAVLLDANGKLLRDLKRTQDDKPPIDQRVPGIVNREVEMADALEGSDGRVYLFSGSVPTTVRVMTPAGQIEREFVLHSPVPEYKRGSVFLTPGTITTGVLEEPIRDAKGKVVSRPVHFVSYDISTGEPVSMFEPNDFKGQVGCFDGESFTILRALPTGKYAIVHATVGK